MANLHHFSKSTLRIRGEIFSLADPVVMGILNVTEDSFYDGGKYLSEKEISARTEKIISEGAAMIDIGACSTRPGAGNQEEKTEGKRLLTALKIVKKISSEIIVSADTFRSSVAEMAVQEGADIINDVSGGELDKKMFGAVARLKVPYVLTHMQGTPGTMQKNPVYKNCTLEILRFFEQKSSVVRENGVTDVILDPGFGFGKTTEHNFELLKNLNVFSTLGYPVLAGISRKSMINKVLKINPQDALNGTSVLHTIALMNGAKILRAHDVKEASEAIKLFSFYDKI